MDHHFHRRNLLSYIRDGASIHSIPFHVPDFRRRGSACCGEDFKDLEVDPCAFFVCFWTGEDSSPSASFDIPAAAACSLLSRPYQRDDVVVFRAPEAFARYVDSDKANEDLIKRIGRSGGLPAFPRDSLRARGRRPLL